MSLWQDIHYGVRRVRNSPAFAAASVLTLALGIGATTSVFSVCDALLWKPVSLPHLESLVTVLQGSPEDPNDWNGATPADVADVRAGSHAIAKLASWENGAANLAGASDRPERVLQALVTANFFDVLGVQPALGRPFQPGEDQPGREREVVLSNTLWRLRFAADSGVIGKTVRLDDQNYIVTGVMPPSFNFPLAAEIWTPMALTPEQRASRRNNMLESIARLSPGATVEQAAAEVAATSARLDATYPATNKNRRLVVWPARRFISDPYTQQYLTMLLGAVMFVLLIACANVANLQFARATGRLREVAVRTALGAGRWRVITQLLTESVLLSLGGALLGLVIANWGVTLMRNGMPPEIERYIQGWKDMQLDTRAFAFTLLAAISAGILSGLAPAWQCSRPNLTDALKEGGRSSSGGRARRRLRNILVSAEIALAVVLLAGAGLMVRGFGSLVEAGARLEPRTLLTLRLSLTANKYPEPHRQTAFYREVLDRIDALPGVRSATAVTSLPYSDHSSGRDFAIEGRPVEPGNIPGAMYQVASASYFGTVHVPLRSGRLLSDSDGPETQKVVVVSEGLARRWWNNESPVGKRIRIGATESKNDWLTVVGVAGDMVHEPLEHHSPDTIYVSYRQFPALWMDIGVRTSADALSLAPAVTHAIALVDPDQPVSDLASMEKQIHNRTIGLNYMAVLMGIFGVLALVLSAIGVYGVMAYMVSEQTQEIGLRLALGAARGNVLGMVFRKGFWTVLAGLGAGMPVAYVLARLMSSLVVGVGVGDPITFIGIPLALISVAALAIYIPARRAMGIDPILALRYE